MGRRRSVLVTHAVDGIGRVASFLLADLGMRVLACGDLSSMRDLPRETAQGGLIETQHLDPGDSDSCVRALERIESLYGHIDSLVLTGGAGCFGSTEEATSGDVRAVFEANFFEPLRLVQLTTPRLRALGRGRLVWVSSAAGRVALPMTGPYSASQYAIEGLCDALRLELSVFNVDVILVEHGLVRRRLVTEAVDLPDPDALFLLPGASPYRGLATALVKAFNELMSKAATPGEVAEVIARALTAHRPKPRYAVKRSTAAILWARRLLPDRMLDGRLAKAMGLAELD